MPELDEELELLDELELEDPELLDELELEDAPELLDELELLDTAAPEEELLEELVGAIYPSLHPCNPIKPAVTSNNKLLFIIVTL